MKKQHKILIIAIIILALITGIVIYTNQIKIKGQKQAETIQNNIPENNQNIDNEHDKEFEINYSQRKDQGIEEMAEGIYTFGGNVTITIEQDMVYELKNALEQNVINVEDILEQAKKDKANGTCETREYDDGGSIEYLYPEYTILKCNELNGNKNVYIGFRGGIRDMLDKALERRD